MQNRYTLRCLAPDGDAVREGEFPTIQAALNRASDMGSRWFFYPVPIVTGTARPETAVILAVPDGMPDQWIGKRLSSLRKAFATNADHVCDWINGKCPLELLP